MDKSISVNENKKGKQQLKQLEQAIKSWLQSVAKLFANVKKTLIIKLCIIVTKMLV